MLKRLLTAGAMACLCSAAAMAAPTPLITVPHTCSAEVSLSAADYATFKAQLALAVQATGNGGLGFNMWATIVAKDGTVCAVAYSGSHKVDQWLAGRVISAQKAATANGLSLGVVTGASTKGQFALSTANLYSATQPGGSLYGLSDSNPVAAAGAYGDRIDTGTGAYIGPLDTTTYGMATDPMVGQVIGGINVFGGGLALFNGAGNRRGGVGVSGDTSCTDHMVAWHLRHNLNLDLLATGGISGPAALTSPGPGDTTHPDNIIFDILANPNGGTGSSHNGFGHPPCLNNPVVNLATGTPTSLPPVQ
jgi:Haem-degrading